jgi:hypothetical protein
MIGTMYSIPQGGFALELGTELHVDNLCQRLSSGPQREALSELVPGTEFKLLLKQRHALSCHHGAAR